MRVTLEAIIIGDEGDEREAEQVSVLPPKWPEPLLKARSHTSYVVISDAIGQSMFLDRNLLVEALKALDKYIENREAWRDETS